MGKILSIDRYKEEKRGLSQGEHTVLDTTPPDAPLIGGEREVLDFEQLVREMGTYLPFALQQVYNVLLFKKSGPVGPMVQFDVSDDPRTPTMIHVDWSGALADVSGSYALLPALAGRTVCIEVDGKKHYVCLCIRGVCETARS